MNFENDTICDDTEDWGQAEQWAGAFLGATMVTSCALGSVCLIPCRHSRFYLLLSNCLVALAISTASGAAFFQLAPSALGLDDEEMTEPFVILPASIMCLVFWYCLTLDKIKANFKRNFDGEIMKEEHDPSEMAIEVRYILFMRY